MQIDPPPRRRTARGAEEEDAVDVADDGREQRHDEGHEVKRGLSEVVVDDGGEAWLKMGGVMG